MNPAEILKSLSEQISVCKNCDLSLSRLHAVPGEGPSNARIMLIGEGPGFHENQQGRPFVGNAGKFLDELLQHANLRRSDVFITNVVKCRPPGNRDPEEFELKACNIFLDQQIDAINPAIIVTLGRFSMAKFFGNVKISQVHGQAKMVDNRLIIAMFHPAAALHQPALKTTIIKDFSKIPELLSKIPEKKIEVLTKDVEKNKDNQGNASQLSLF